MARLRRYDAPGVPQHVIQRGNNRTALFAAPGDYEHFRKVLRLACRQQECAVHAYVLMTNHVHILLTPTRVGGIGRVMQSVGRRYVRYFNEAYGRSGTLWEGRYRATVIETESYLLTCHRYIEQNPVRAGMVRDASEYPWSSHRANALGTADSLVTMHACHVRLGLRADDRRAAYRALFDAPLDEPTLGTIRDAINTGWALGNNRFRDELMHLTGRRSARLPAGRRGASSKIGV